MQEKFILNKWDVTTILLNCIICKLYTNFTRIFTQISGTGVLWTLLMICVIAVLGILYVSRFYKKFEGKDIIDVAETALGKFGKCLAGVILLIYLMLAAVFTMREFSELLQTALFTNSTTLFIAVFFMSAMVVGAFLGMPAVSRLHALFVPLIVIMTLIIPVSISPLFDVSNFFPVLGNGAQRVFGEGFFTVSIFADVILLFLLAPFYAEGLSVRRAGLSSVVLSSVFVIIIPLAYLAAIPFPVSAENNFPMYLLTKLISYGRFFQTAGAGFLTFGILSAMLYLSLLLFAITYVFKKTFSLPNNRPMTLCFSAVILTLVLMLRRYTVVYYFIYNSIYFAWAVAFAVPLVFLIIGNARSKIKERKANESV